VVTVVPLGLPGEPIELKARAMGSSVTLTWVPPPSDGGTPITGYLLFRGPSPLDLILVAELGDIDTFADVDVEEGDRYHYAIVAVNAVGQGSPSEPVAVTVSIEQMAAPDGLPAWVIFAGIGALIIGLAAAASTEVGKYQMSLWALPLLARLNKEGVLDNKNRYYILGIIIDNPGIHYNAIIQEFEVPMGVATHHLSVLEKENYIRSVRDGRLKCFYSAHTRIPEKPSKTPEEVRGAIVELVKRRSGISQLEVMEELGIDRDSASYYLRELVKDGTMANSKEGRYTVYRVKER
jgi:DNA-binding MarR family transcriptional regulator